MRLINTIILLPIFFYCGIYAQKNVKKTLTIQEQGSFAIGGTITTDENGNQFHGDHGYVFYQKPTHPLAIIISSWNSPIFKDMGKYT